MVLHQLLKVCSIELDESMIIHYEQETGE